MNYKVDHIPTNTPYNKRPGTKMNPEYITIHSTANLNSTAQSERDWLTNTSNARVASWHICVDENEAVEAIPLNEVAWHAGDGSKGPGNRKSISIEICESGDREKTLENAVELVAKMLKERGWGVDKLRRHYDWSKKNCPRILNYNNWEGWEIFKQQVKKELDITGESKIKILLHGQGKEVEGIFQNGTNYVPIRFLEQLGYDVGWENGAVTISYKGVK